MTLRGYHVSVESPTPIYTLEALSEFSGLKANKQIIYKTVKEYGAGMGKETERRKKREYLIKTHYIHI